MKKNSGVTVIALVVTVVILVILSSITLRILIKNGIVIGTERQREMYENKTVTEQKKLDRLENEYKEATSVEEKKLEGQVTIKIKDSKGMSIEFNAMIHIYNTNRELIKDVTINGTEVTTTLPYGNYYLTTETAPPGYNNLGDEINFGIYSANTVVDVAFNAGTELPDSGWTEPDQYGQVTIKIKDSNGIAVNYKSTIHIYNRMGDLVKDVEINGTEVTTTLPYSFYYRLTTETDNVEIIFEVKSENTVVEVILPRNDGNIQVAVRLYTIGDDGLVETTAPTRQKFYIALFRDEYYTDRVSDVHALSFEEGIQSESTTTFTGLKVGKYYVALTDENGVAITIGNESYTPLNPMEAMEITDESPNAQAEIGIVYYTLPDESESQVTIKIKDSNGPPIEFYATIHIYNTSGEFIKDVTINGTEVTTTLPYGNYYLTTETAPVGYNNLNDEINFEVNSENTVVEMAFNSGSLLPET